jgi:hypothetical protein|tara:strand:- start:37 stop:231 length:195 start_codon:yes stop_codon:yes gene_type:complete
MTYINLLFIVGLILLVIGMYSAFSLLKLSLSKTKEELQETNIINLWILFAICAPTGLALMYPAF